MKTPENAIAELYRLLLNMIRKGVVTEVDTDKWVCRVRTGELETTWLNWLTLRAGKGKTWWAPSPGEQVILLAVGGDLTTAFVLPAIFSNGNPPPSVSEDAMVVEFPDGGWFEYEPETGRYLVKAGARMIFEAPGSIDIKTGQLNIEAEVTIGGGVTQTGGDMSSNGVVVDKHLHGGVVAGGAKSGGPE